MKIKKGNWKINLKSFFRIEFKGIVPKITIHEKFEKIVKWILRLLSLIGILTSFISFDYITGIIISLLIFVIERILEKIIFEYTIFYIPTFPDFDIKYEKWLSTGYYILEEEDRHLLLEGSYSYMGPLYEDKEYAEKFFSFIKSWNNFESFDKENNINISIIIENNKQYSMYLYPNYSQHILDKFFKKHKKNLALEKYGKTQQELVMQFVFWYKNLNQGDFFHRFIEDYKISKHFYFVPFYLENNNLNMIKELKILKTQIKIKNRNEINKNEIEYHYN